MNQAASCREGVFVMRRILPGKATLWVTSVFTINKSGELIQLGTAFRFLLMGGCPCTPQVHLTIKMSKFGGAGAPCH